MQSGRLVVLGLQPHENRNLSHVGSSSRLVKFILADVDILDPNGLVLHLLQVFSLVVKLDFR